MQDPKDTPKVLSANLFPVVGIGASAGGLDAFKRLLKAIPEDSGMAYVLVQHLDPNHESILPELLQKVTKIPVLEISDDIKVHPNHIYIIPSNKMLVANDGVLQLSPRPPKSKNEPNLPIDLFFTSLAEVHQTEAIGVVLSGTASDGTKGLQAIKEYGGITFAQDQASAAYEGMPESAAQAGVVDFILPPEAIVEKLMEIKAQLDRREEDLLKFPQQEEEIFKQILALIRVRKGTDFTYYKQSTIRRRILRRMTIHKNREIAAYLEYLKNNKTEQDALFQDLLIPVTAFFRDAKIFDYLCATVFPQIVANKTAGEPIRCWVAGCSTGEEAYSMAMCFQELLGNENSNVQIFATDISEPAIAKARAGIYTKNRVDGISPQQLEACFVKVKGGYQVKKSVRNMCVFAVHDFLKDPPFGKMDFISCRNVLIYLEPYLQKKALTTFHYALKPKGSLLLGKAETSSVVPELFTFSDKYVKVFTRKDVPARFIHVNTQRNEPNLYAGGMHSKSVELQTDFQKTADEILLSRYTPAGVVINEAMDIVHFRGNTSLYLEQAPGKPSHNLLKMAKSGLAFELRRILYKVKKSNEAVEKSGIPVQVQGRQHTITIEAIPLLNIVEPHYLIFFHGIEIKTEAKYGQLTSRVLPGSQENEESLYVHQLENEIAQNREDMRNITDDQEAVNEELQSSNEELLSGSEELQSLNEELETSKEELQSTNESLTVVNQELISLNEQVTASRNYAESIIATIHEPLLIMDKALRIQSANKSFYKNFQVTEKDTKGKLLYDLGNRQWDIPQLRKLLEDIAATGTQIQDFELTLHLPDLGERIILLNASHIIQKNQGGGQLILLAMDDITEVRMKIIELQNKEKELLNKDITDYKLNKVLLEKEVAERTRQLEETNKDLVFQNGEKEKRTAELIIANKDLESFTYVSSHDMQEPLRKIQTFIKLILDNEADRLSEKGQDYFRRIQNATGRMRQLITDLLDFTSIKTLDRKFERTDMGMIVAEVKNDFKEILAEKQGIIEVSPLCSADIIPFQFRQLMQNLISNAIKFSSPIRPPHIIIEGKIAEGAKFNKTFRLGEKELLPDQRYCHIAITDNGIGFLPEYKERIFDLLQRLHGKEEYPGTGIGLAIVKKVVENHRGMITATSELDQGARFDIYLPVTD